MTEQIKNMMATINADRVLLRILVARSAVMSKRPKQLTETDSKMKLAYEIALDCHRKGGCTPEQLQSLEKVACQIEEVCK